MTRDSHLLRTLSEYLLSRIFHYNNPREQIPWGGFRNVKPSIKVNDDFNKKYVRFEPNFPATYKLGSKESKSKSLNSTNWKNPIEQTHKQTLLEELKKMQSMLQEMDNATTVLKSKYKRYAPHFPPTNNTGVNINQVRDFKKVNPNYHSLNLNLPRMKEMIKSVKLANKIHKKKTRSKLDHALERNRVLLSSYPGIYRYLKNVLNNKQINEKIRTRMKEEIESFLIELYKNKIQKVRTKKLMNNRITPCITEVSQLRGVEKALDQFHRSFFKRYRSIINKPKFKRILNNMKNELRTITSEEKLREFQNNTFVNCHSRRIFRNRYNKKYSIDA